MSTYFTTYAAYPLGRWLAAMAAGLVLLALACAQAPDLTEQLSLSSPNTHPVPKRQRGCRLAPSQAPVLASAQLCQPSSAAPHTPLTQ